MEKQVVITADDEVKIMDYTGYESMSKGVDGGIEHFYTMEVPKMIVPEGKIDMWCDESFLNNSKKTRINAICSALSQEVIYGDVVLTVYCGNGESRGFEYVEEVNEDGSVEEGICETWLCEDLFLRLKNDMNKQGLLEYNHKTFDRESMDTIKMDSKDKQKGEDR